MWSSLQRCVREEGGGTNEILGGDSCGAEGRKIHGTRKRGVLGDKLFKVLSHLIFVRHHPDDADTES